MIPTEHTKRKKLDDKVFTFPWYELVNFVRLFGFRSMEFLHFFDVRGFVEGTSKSSLELCIVWFWVSLTPSTRVLCPFLSDKLTHKQLNCNLHLTFIHSFWRLI